MITTTFKKGIRLLACAGVLLGLVQAPALAETGAAPKAGAPFSMEFREADIRDVLRAVGQALNLNLIVSDTVSGQVSMSLKDVDLWDALESILKTKGLTYVREGKIVRVLSVIEARDEDLETRVFPLGYANGKRRKRSSRRSRATRRKFPSIRARTPSWSRTSPSTSTAWNG